MDNLALIYETSSIVNSNAVRPQLINDIKYYHFHEKFEKRDELFEHVTDAELGILIAEGVVPEAFEPRQRSMWQAAKDKVGGALGGQESGSRNKIVELYQKVWAEYIKYTKHLSTTANNYAAQQRGLGNTSAPQNTNAMTGDNMTEFLLKVLKLDPKVINAAFKQSNVQQDAPTIDKKQAGAIIYKALQLRYQSAAPQQQYTPSFQLPQSL
jgi:uncharacterized protein YecA (UPF0149 family)